MDRPHFYYMDLENYNDDFLRKIILWQKEEFEAKQKEYEEIIQKNYKRNFELQYHSGEKAQKTIEGTNIKIQEVIDLANKKIRFIQSKIHDKHTESNKKKKLYGVWQELIKFRIELEQMLVLK